MAKSYNVWDRLAKKYDYLWVQKYSLLPTRERVKRAVAEHCCGDNFVLLDLGCATGQLLFELRDDGFGGRLCGVDKSSEMIRLAKNWDRNMELLCVDVDLGDLPRFFKEGSVDVIVCCHSFPYYKNKDGVLAEIHKILSDNGIAIFVQAAVNNFYDKLVLQAVEATAEKADYLSRETFRKLAERHFEIIEEFTIKEQFFMPSICGFVLRKRP
jgi:ubiquinone/menaquinone biosynthesis C-methylase UbiE